MKCFRCHRIIDKNSNYYSFTEFNLGQIINIDYAHRKCWDEFLKQVGNTDEAMGVVRGMKKKLKEMGLLPDDEVVIC